MNTTGSVTVARERAEVYAFVSDPRRLAACIPGCTNLRELEAGTYAATLSSRVGFLTAKFDVMVKIVREDPGAAIDATIAGTAVGMPGRLEAKAGVVLADAAGGGTLIRYAVDVALTGKLGGLGQPVFRAKSEELAREFGANLASALDAARGSRA